jgi:putative CocE/NonD family hydrolase
MANALAPVLLLLFAVTAAAQSPAPPAAEEPELLNRTEVMIPMRDGARLQTLILTPKDAKGPLPILLRRTPYGVKPPQDFRYTAKNLQSVKELLEDGYIFAVQSIRGRFQSEGRFVMIRPLRDPRDAKAVDESTDAYDTVDWLVKNVPNNNGRVGLRGVSYDAFTTVMALALPHPALKAVSEQASPDDMFMGDDFHHNGAFRLDYAFEYVALLESNKEDNTTFKFDKHDLYDWYLELGGLGNVNKLYFHNQMPTWNDFVQHPNDDLYWRIRSFDSFLRTPSVPTLNVAGWWDQEDFYGPQRIYQLLEAGDSKHLNYFVAGPWNHGGWAVGPGDRLGPVDFGSATAQHFRAQIQAPWFRYWLHGKGTLDLKEATVFQTGSNQWKTYESWPPKNAAPRKLYFHAGRKLSFESPAETGDAFDSYISDPANPVPYRPRPIRSILTPDWPVWLVQDQRFVDHRPDVLTWQTDPLQEDVAVTGDIVADLFAATSGTDSDWIVKLIDVFPEDYGEPKEPKQEPNAAPPAVPAITGGYQLIIADEVFRGRYRNSFEHPEPIPSGQVLEYKIDLHTNDHVFGKGHRIMVQVQSTWFPLIDRNPQTFVPNIYEAAAADYVKATQRIYRSADAPSSILLPGAE